MGNTMELNCNKKKKAYGLLTLFVDECPSTILKPRDGLLYEAKKLRPKVT